MGGQIINASPSTGASSFDPLNHNPSFSQELVTHTGVQVHGSKIASTTRKNYQDLNLKKWGHLQIHAGRLIEAKASIDPCSHTIVEWHQ